MKPFMLKGIGGERLSSANSSDVKTATIPASTSAIHVTVETSPMRVTYDPTGDPSTGVGVVYQHAQSPITLLIGPGSTIKVSAQSAASVIQLAYLS